MKIVHTIAETRAAVREARRRGGIVGVVPTMGALHAGHAELIRRAREGCDFLVVTVFVNPIQFDDPSDYGKYPQVLDADAALCRERGADLVFAPSAAEMYPRPVEAFVEVGGVTEEMEGRFRPGHFRGVATVVSKLFHIVLPDRAWFGEKDAQQLAVLRRMVDDLNFPVEIAAVPTVREPDGLALSSRNARLNADERGMAIALYEALNEARRAIESGERSAAAVTGAAGAVFARYPGVHVDYFEVADPDEMRPVERIAGPVRLAGAIRVGATRLIDNMAVDPAARK